MAAQNLAEGPLKRIRAARKLWKEGDKEDAAALVFVAVAAVARLRYPRNTCSDREAYTKFIRDELATITDGASPASFHFPHTTKLPEIQRTENVALEEVLYGAWRCVMIHEARWPDEVYLTPTRANSDYPTYIDLPPDGRVGLPEEWILGLAFAVENAVEIALPRILKYPVYIVLSGPMDPMGAGMFQVKAQETKVPRMLVRNQQAIPVFTTVRGAEALIVQYQIPKPFVSPFADAAALRDFVVHGTQDDRFIFDPAAETLLPSYSRDSLLAALH